MYVDELCVGTPNTVRRKKNKASTWRGGKGNSKSGRPVTNHGLLDTVLKVSNQSTVPNIELSTHRVIYHAFYPPSPGVAVFLVRILN